MSVPSTTTTSPNNSYKSGSSFLTPFGQVHFRSRPSSVRSSKSGENVGLKSRFSTSDYSTIDPKNLSLYSLKSSDIQQLSKLSSGETIGQKLAGHDNDDELVYPQASIHRRPSNNSGSINCQPMFASCNSQNSLLSGPGLQYLETDLDELQPPSLDESLEYLDMDGDGTLQRQMSGSDCMQKVSSHTSGGLPLGTDDTPLGRRGSSSKSHSGVSDLPLTRRRRKSSTKSYGGISLGNNLPLNNGLPQNHRNLLSNGARDTLSINSQGGFADSTDAVFRSKSAYPYHNFNQSHLSNELPTTKSSSPWLQSPNGTPLDDETPIPKSLPRTKAIPFSLEAAKNKIMPSKLPRGSQTLPRNHKNKTGKPVTNGVQNGHDLPHSHTSDAIDTDFIPNRPITRSSSAKSHRSAKKEISDDAVSMKCIKPAYSSIISETEKKLKESALDFSILDRIKNGSKGLRCLDTFCTDCLQQVVMVKKSGIKGYKCPTCLHFSQKGDYTHLFVMDDFYDIFRLICNKNQKCQRCMKKRKGEVAETAEWRCLNCKINLCERCKLSHDDLVAFRGHKYISNKRVPLYLVTQSVHCAHHPGQLEGNLYCKQCEVCVCRTCLETQHKGHEQETIHSATERITEVVDTGIKKIENDVKELADESAFLEKEAKHVTDAYTTAEKEYTKNYENTIKKLRQKFEADVAELHRKRAEDNRKIEKALNDIQQQVKDMKKTLFITKYALQNTRGSSLIKALDGGLHAKIKDEGNKTMNSHILDIALPQYEVDDYVNLEAKCRTLLGTPDYKPREVNYEVTKFCNGRQVSGSFEELIQTMRLVTVFNVRAHPDRLGLVDGQVWLCELPHEDYTLDDRISVGVFSLQGKLVRSFVPERVRGAHDLAQVNETDVIIAGGNGLFVFNIDGSLQYQITSGHFCYISTAGHKVASVNEDTNEVIILKYVGDRWLPHQSFKLLDGDEENNIVSLHLVKDVVYVSERTNYVHVYTLEGKLLNRFFRANGEVVFRLCGTDGRGAVFSTTYDSKHLHMLSAHGQWATAALAGVEKVEDVCVKGDYVYLLQNCKDYYNFRYVLKVSIYELQ